MASSQVEVKETNSPYEISPDSINGIDIQPHIDGEPPKDHTYNKDPEIIEAVQEEIVESFCAAAAAQEEEEDLRQIIGEVPQKLNRNRRNVKHKFIKSHGAEKTPKSPMKKGAAKKGSVKKVTNSVEALTSNLFEKENAMANNVASEDVENISPKQTTKKAQKRKIDESEAKLPSGTESSTKKERLTSSKDEKKSAKKEQKVTKSDKKKEKDVKKKIMIKKPLKSKSVVKDVVSKSVSKDVPKKKDTSKNSSYEDNASLPPGWTRKIVERKSGKTAGQFDTYIYSPEGIKFRSRPDVAAYLARTNSNLSIEDFSFTKRRTPAGAIKSTVASAPPPPKKQAKTVEKVKQKKKAGGFKKAKLLVKLNTPKKVLSIQQKNEKKTSSSKEIIAKPSTSGISQKRVGVHRRKK